MKKQYYTTKVIETTPDATLIEVVPTDWTKNTTRYWVYKDGTIIGLNGIHLSARSYTLRKILLEACGL